MLSSYKIINCLDPTNAQDVATKNYVDSAGYLTQSTADGRYYRNTVTLNNITQPTGSVNMGG